MIRLTYVSTARKPLTAVELEDVLRVSRKNNARDDVTGLLVVGGRRFLQALEGPAKTVEQVFERIEKDPRHFAVVRLSREEVQERAFGGWAMGYTAGKAVTDPASSLKTVVAKLIEPIEDPRVRGYFTGFADTHATAY